MGDLPRVLIVEPYEEIRLLMRAALEHAGHEVETIDNGGEALEAIERERFSCLVIGSPVWMEGRAGGTLLLDCIERNRAERSPSVVVVTTHIDDPALLAAAERLDAWAVFAKPFSTPQLLAVIGECIAGRRPPQRWFGIPASSLEAAASSR